MTTHSERRHYDDPTIDVPKDLPVHEARLLVTHYDIAEANHERWPCIMDRFVASFDKPLHIGGRFDEFGSVVVGYIMGIHRVGADVWGEIHWIDRPEPPEPQHVRMNWSFGPGTWRVSLSSGFLDHWGPRERYEDDEDWEDSARFGPESDDGDDEDPDDLYGEEDGWPVGGPEGWAY